MSIYDYQGNMVLSNDVTLKAPWKSCMHRGYSSNTVHENTMVAFYRAWQNGAEWVELDARLASDGVYVISHDPSITVNGTTYVIAETPSSTLKNLVLSRDQEYGDCHVPLLETALKFSCYSGMTINLDCKTINPETLSKLVVDCGMSGKVKYANTIQANAETILQTDPNAGFIIGYENMQWWLNTLTNYYTRQKTYMWASEINYEMLENTRSEGFKFLLADQSTTSNMHFAPDCIEFASTSDCKTLNRNYLESLSFV